LLDRIASSWALVVATPIFCGCATALSSFQPAHVPEPGHVQAEFGTDLSLSTGAINKVVDASVALNDAANTRSLSNDEKRRIIEGGANLGMNPPAIIPHAGLAYAPLRNWELSGRLATSGWRLATRYQLLEQSRATIDLSAGFGIGTALFDPPIHQVLDKLRVVGFSRWNVDIPVAIGQHGSWYRWWGGPRFVYSATSQDLILTVPNEVEVRGTVAGHALYVGGHAGAALGYKSLFIGPELTVVRMFGSATVTAIGESATVSIDALVIYPAFAVMGEF
jgi:hypothetical protein